MQKLVRCLNIVVTGYQMSKETSEIIFLLFFLSSHFLSLFLLLHHDLRACRLPKSNGVVSGNETLSDQINASPSTLVTHF